MAQFQQNIYCLLSIVVENIKFLTDFLDDFLPDRVDIQSWSRSTRLDQDGDDQQCPHERQGEGQVRHDLPYQQNTVERRERQPEVGAIYTFRPGI